MFLHGAGEAQRDLNEFHACLRHGIPKTILCYDKLEEGTQLSSDVPLAPRLRSRNQNGVDAKLSTASVPIEVYNIVAEEFINVRLGLMPKITTNKPNANSTYADVSNKRQQYK